MIALIVIQSNNGGPFQNNEKAIKAHVRQNGKKLLKEDRTKQDVL